MQFEGRILAVDPGEKRIGLALSDGALTLASPLTVIGHLSMLMDAAQIAKIAEDNQAKLIIVGMPTGGEGEEIRQSRHSLKLIETIQSQTTIPVKPWDETGSTQQAQQWLVEGGKARTKRVGHQDALAAAAILQNYLDAMKLIRADNNEKK